MKKTSYLLFLLFCFSCSNKIIVQKAVPETDMAQKLFYTLPENTLDFELKVSEEKYERGIFFEVNSANTDYISVAIDSLGLDKKVLEELKTKKVYTKNSLAEDDLKWTEGAVPDKDKIYVIQNKPAFFKDNSFTFAFNRDWMAGSATLTTDNKTFEIATTFISTIFSAVTSFAKSGKRPADSPPNLEKVAGGALAYLVKLKKEYVQFQLNPPLSANAEALTMMKAARLRQIEKTVEDLFYKKGEKTKVIRFSLVIPKVFDNDTELKFLKVDPTTGKILLNASLKGDLIWPTAGGDIVGFAPADAAFYVLKSETDLRSVQNTLKKFPVIEAGTNYGLVYNVPKMIRFSLLNSDANTLKSSVFPVAQLGYVNTLDTRLSKADFKLDSISGSLLKVSLESKSIVTSDRITKTGALLQQGDSTFRKPTALKKLQDEVSELELRAKKKELEEKLK